MSRATPLLVCLFIGSFVASVFGGGPHQNFVRGDCNDNRRVNLRDPRFLLNYLYANGPKPRCFDACDADDSGTPIQLMDAVYLILYLQHNGPPPPRPFPRAGRDRTADSLGCRRGSGELADPTATDMLLESVMLRGEVDALEVGDVVDLRVFARLVDGSKLNVTANAQWEVSNPEVVAVASGPHATLTALAAGTSHVSADFANEGSNVLVVEISPVGDPASTLESLTLSTSSAVLEVGESVPLNVFGSYSDGTRVDVTDRVHWTMSDPATATIAGASPAILTGLEVGSCEVTSSHDGMISNMLPIAVVSPPEGVITAASISRHGITWNFDGAYEVGEFVNGDYWVVGPVKIVSIDPRSVESDGRVRNGSMINLTPGLSHGWDSTLYGSGAKDHYKPDLNVAYGVRPGNPLVVPAGSSLVSCISKEQAGSKPGLKSAAVLTVLAAPPPAGSFRPPYAGTQKPLLNLSQVRTERLGNLPVVPDTPDPDGVAADFSRVWLEHQNTHMSKFHHPEDNMPWYGRDIARDLGRAALLLQVDLPLQKKQRLLIRFLQIGIDLDGLRNVGMYWPGDGGHMVGRKFPILFKRTMFGQNSNLGNNPTRFSEDDQTFYVEETSPGVYNHGFPTWSNPANHPEQCVGVHKYGPEQLGMPEWSVRHWSVNPIGSKDAGHTWSDGPTLSCDNDNHRFCCTYRCLAGHFLAAYAMDLRAAWRWDPAFDYMDRHMQIAPGWHRQKDRWVEAMWDAHRHTFGGYDAVPDSWIPRDLPNP